MWNSSKFVVASIALCAAVSFAAGLVPQNLDYSDHLQELRNPARGVTGHKGFYLSPGKALDLKSNGTVYNDFMRFLVDLGGFSSNAWTYEGEGDARVKVPRGESQPLDEISLNNVRAALDSVRRRGGACTIRASYDIDCRGSQDPDIETTLTHTKQLAELYSDYEDVIHFVELGMFGTCGEMTTGTQENHAKALRTFLENSSDGIKVGVRSPQVVALWMGLKDAYSTWYVFPDFRADSERFQDSAKSERYAKYMSRVGLYNDGYLGSDTDLGTYGAGEPYPISRENVVSWLEEFGEVVPYGGDFVCNYNPETRPPLNTAEFLAYEGFRTHTSYIGGSMAGECYNFMDTVVFKGPDEEYRGKVMGREYVRDHLGYRFVLRGSEVTDFVGVGGELRLKLKIQNVGFGNNLTAKKATLVLKPADSAVEAVVARDVAARNAAAAATAAIELPLEMDPTKILSKKWKLKSETPMQDWTGANFGDILEDELEFDGVNEFNLKVLLPDSVKTGKWNAYLRISHYGDMKTDKNFHVIQFANDSSYFDNVTGGNFVGGFVVDEHVQAVGNSHGGAECGCDAAADCCIKCGTRVSGRLISTVHESDAAEASLNAAIRAGAVVYDIRGERAGVAGAKLRAGVYIVK